MQGGLLQTAADNTTAGRRHLDRLNLLPQRVYRPARALLIIGGRPQREPATRRIPPEILHRCQRILDAPQMEFDHDLPPELKLQPPDRLSLMVHTPEVRKPAHATLAHLLRLVV